MRIAYAALIVVVTVAGASAQERRFARSRPGPIVAGDFSVIRGEFGIANQVVRGAPYTAEAVTEFRRTLADGNKIQRTSTATVARDSEGRTRRELNLEAIGPLAAARNRRTGKTVFINDPSAGVSYILDPVNRTVRQMPMRVRGASSPQSNSPQFKSRLGAEAAGKTEDLGTQSIQGVSAQGKRVTRTIPAGQAGNQLPIDIVTETWYSPDLQVVVMSKTSDPRFGETVYQLNNINRVEPDRTLFVPPSDYSVPDTRRRMPGQ